MCKPCYVPLLLLTGMLFLGIPAGSWAQPDIGRQTGIPGIVDADTPYRTVSKMPSFPGGSEAFRQYLSKNLIYPTGAIERNIQGTVLIEFVIRQDGVITDVRTLSAPDAVLTDEAERAIRNMPRWVPGELDGKIVSVYYRVPVVFRMEDAGRKKGLARREKNTSGIADADTPYRVVSKMPAFPGGTTAPEKIFKRTPELPPKSFGTEYTRIGSDGIYSSERWYGNLCESSFQPVSGFGHRGGTGHS